MSSVTCVPLRRSLWVKALTLTVFVIVMSPAKAQDFYIGQIIMGAWNFCPQGTLPAEGQLVSIGQNQALFALLGTTFGGDGTTSFALPDLRSRTPVGRGASGGNPDMQLGQTGGQASTSLTVSNLPPHAHTVNTTASGTLRAAVGPATSASADGNALSNTAPGTYTSIGQPLVELRSGTVSVDVDTMTGSVGSAVPFENRGPYIGLTYCIVTVGIFPMRP